MLGRRYKIKFLNLKLPIHMGVPRAYRNILCFIATPLIFQFRPSLGHICLNGVTKNQRGDHWVKIIFLSKKFSKLNGNVFEIYEIVCWLPKHIFYSFVIDRTLCAVRARFWSMLVACTTRAQIYMHHKWIKNMFLESAKYFLNFQNIPIQFWELFHSVRTILVRELFHSVRTILVWARMRDSITSAWYYHADVIYP